MAGLQDAIVDHRITGAQVHWLTLGATLAPSSSTLFKQVAPLDTGAYQVNLTVR